MNEWTEEEVNASRPTVAIVNERGEVVQHLDGEEAKRAEDGYFYALKVSQRLL